MMKNKKNIIISIIAFLIGLGGVSCYLHLTNQPNQSKLTKSIPVKKIKKDQQIEKDQKNKKTTKKTKENKSNKIEEVPAKEIEQNKQPIKKQNEPINEPTNDGKKSELTKRGKRLWGVLPLNNQEIEQVINLLQQEKSVELNQLLDQLTTAKMGQEIEKFQAIRKVFASNQTDAPADFSATNFVEMDYRVNDDLTITPENGQEWASDQEAQYYWQKIRKLIPTSLLRQINGFDCTKSTEQNPATHRAITAGETIVEGNSISLSVSLDAPEKVFKHTIIHEFGHVISLNQNQRNPDQPLDYSAPIEGMGFYDHSYLKLFFEQFWQDLWSNYQASTDRYLFFIRHLDLFVTWYSATSFVEDFAESFAAYVLGDFPDEKFKINLQTKEVQAKMKFFANFPKLAKLKQEIQRRIQK